MSEFSETINNETACAAPCQACAEDVGQEEKTFYSKCCGFRVCSYCKSGATLSDKTLVCIFCKQSLRPNALTTLPFEQRNLEEFRERKRQVDDIYNKSVLDFANETEFDRYEEFRLQLACRLAFSSHKTVDVLEAVLFAYYENHRKEIAFRKKMNTLVLETKGDKKELKKLLIKKTVFALRNAKPATLTEIKKEAKLVTTRSNRHFFADYETERRRTLQRSLTQLYLTK